MSASAGTGVFVLSLMSIPTCYLFNSLIYSNSSEAFFFAGGTTVIILVLSVRFILKRTPIDPLFYVFAVYAILSVVNLIIGLEQDNIIDGFVTFYLKVADPHINTAHGHMISYWDGCFHYLMYLLMIAAITWGDSYRAIGLYWVGSCLMRSIVYILGNAVGKYGIAFGPLFLVHMLYVSVSVWACFRIFGQPSSRSILTNIEGAEKRGLLHRPQDLLFVIYLIPAFAFCVFRGLIVLDWSGQWAQDYTHHYEPYLKDPSAYPRVQMLVSMLYSAPYYIVALYALMVPGCEWMSDLTLVHSGALAQTVYVAKLRQFRKLVNSIRCPHRGLRVLQHTQSQSQFSHIGASLHTRTPFSYRVPVDGQPFFLLINVLYAVVPQILCYRCHTQPAFFLRTTTEKKTD